jgi:alpha-glucosidase (family GH31 glycosyl hydrolase)
VPRGLAVVAVAAITVAALVDSPASSPQAKAPTAGVVQSIASKPLRIALTTNGKTLTVLGSITYTTPDGREHPLGRILARDSHRTLADNGAEATTTLSVATGERGRSATVSISSTQRRARFSVQLRPANGITALRVTLAAPASAHFLGTGEQTQWVDVRRTVQPLKVWNGCGSSASSPFFVSSTGFGAYVENDPDGRVGFPGAADDPSFACDLGVPPCSVGPPVAAVRLCVKAATLKLDVFAGSLKTTIGDFAKLVGRPKPPWLPEFGLMKWRDQIDGPAELFDDIHELRSRDIPIGWVILDNPWEQGASSNDCFGSLRFDPSRYPNPAAMIASIHRRNVRFMLWISPELKLDGCPPAPYPDGWLVGDDQYYVRDLSNPAERADFVARLRALAALGVDGFKGDRGDEVDLEKLRLHAGSGVAFQNLYVKWYQQAVAAAIAPYRRNWASLFRTSVPGSAAIVPGFVGSDSQHTWDGLQGAIRQVQTAGVVGDAMWGSDIGGYDGGPEVTSELFVRWSQFAALTPIFEVGGAGENAEFWNFGPAGVAAFRASATLHYELVPYLFALVREASQDGLPAVRPLALTWPSDNRAWAQDSEFTVGSALLSAPVISPANGATTSTAVYLPRGRWIDFFTGTRLSGRRTIDRQSGTTDFPLYLRVGTALPFNFRAPEVWASPWRPNDLERASRQGWLVAPSSGSSARAQSGRTQIVARQPHANKTVIELTDAERHQQLMVFTSSRVCRVTANGVGVPRVATATGMQSRAAAWLVESAAPRALVLKLTLAKAGDAGVVLSGCR